MSNRTKPPKGTKIIDAPPSGLRKSRVFTQNRPRGRPFPRGNPGRPPGARNRSTVMLERMFAGEAEDIGRKAVELAKDGTVTAIKLILDRTYPSRRGRLIAGLKLPPIKSAADAVAAMGTITDAIAAGTITVEEARDLATIVETFRRAHELADLESRVADLEKEKADAASTGQDR